jgi:D-beta-D-heptose 7-phosphate kinase / D-beta-D-heptose 1-phosphate adenosyltransferase
VIRVVVNGTFDILHLGHLALLNYAAGCGDHLMVYIDSDHSVKQLKGPNRPINSQQERAELLRQLRMVDQVEIFHDQTHLALLLEHYQPDIMVKGSDYRDKHITGAEFCKKVVYFDRIEPYSTTKKIQDIGNR